MTRPVLNKPNTRPVPDPKVLNVFLTRPDPYPNFSELTRHEKFSSVQFFKFINFCSRNIFFSIKSVQFWIKMVTFSILPSNFGNIWKRMQFLTRNYPKFLGLTRPDPTRNHWANGLTRPDPTREGPKLPDPTRGSKISDPQHP